MNASSGAAITVIVPAYNRVETVGDTLDSLLAQSESGWRALVVDDGSVDGTADAVAAYAERDRRIELLQQPNAGVSSARNLGIAAAHSEWLFFLDADDWLLPDAFETLLELAAADPEADAVLGSCLRVDESGRELWTQRAEQGRDLFPVFARTCAIVIHSCLVKTDLIKRAGAFDDSLVTCEDWDLWQRIARLGARFAATPKTVGVYRRRQASASRDGLRMLEDGLTVIDRGHGDDPRLPETRRAPLPASAGEGKDVASTYFLCYAAGLEIAAGNDALGLIERLGEGLSANVDSTGVAEILFESVADGLAASVADWPTFPAGTHDRCREFLRVLGDALGDRWNTMGALDGFERLLLAESRDARPCQSGRWYLIEVDIAGDPPGDLRLAPGTERVLCRVRCGVEVIGDLELPAFDLSIPARVLADAIVAEFSWPLLQAFFQLHAYGRLEIVTQAGTTTISDGGEVLFEGTLNPLRGEREAIHDSVGWELFLRDVWDRPSLRRADFYADEADEDGTEARSVSAGAAARAAVDIAEPLPAIALEDGPVVVAVSVAGVPLAVIECSGERGGISAHRLRREILMQTGFEICRVVVREAIVMAGGDGGPSLRERLRTAAVRRRGDGSGLLGAAFEASEATVIGRGPGPEGGSSCRWMSLPVAAVGARVALAELDGEPVTGPRNGAARHLVLAPIPRDAGVAAPARRSDDELLQGLLVPTGRSGRPLGRLRRLGRRRRGGERTATQLPILMYHRVAPRGGASTRRWRLHPEAFEEQLAFLRGEGYRSLSFDQWRAACDRRHPIPERSVMLTFDDGYADFPTEALPLLSRYGFGATMFVVTGMVGGFNAWDADLGERVELMDWEAIASIQAEGIEVGSHSSRHDSLVSVDPARLVEDLCDSRRSIQERLGTEVRAVCYPYGIHDVGVAYVAAACGFDHGVTTNEWRASFGDHPLRLPRLEVDGNDPLENFVAKLRS